MTRHHNTIADFYSEERVSGFVESVLRLAKAKPFIIIPHRGIRNETMEVISREGLRYYSTVKKTTLFYDPKSDSFLKILHPLGAKNKILYKLRDISAAIYRLYERLARQGVRLSPLAAYGRFKKTGAPFYVAGRVEGRSLFDLVIKDGKTPPLDTYEQVLKEVMWVHRLGYWFRDAHLSDFFVKDDRLSGVIDFNEIRKNRVFKKKRFAKDLAGLNHPALPLGEEEKMSLINTYMNGMGLKSPQDFLRDIEFYTRRRWAKRLPSDNNSPVSQ